MFANVDGWTIASIVLGAATVFAGVWLALAKSKIAEALDLLAKAVKLGKDTLDASADGSYSDAEKAVVKQDWEDLEAAAKALVAKKV
jgi:hypothetical protein